MLSQWSKNGIFLWKRYIFSDIQVHFQFHGGRWLSKSPLGSYVGTRNIQLMIGHGISRWLQVVVIFASLAPRDRWVDRLVMAMADQIHLWKRERAHSRSLGKCSGICKSLWWRYWIIWRFTWISNESFRTGCTNYQGMQCIHNSRNCTFSFLLRGRV